MNSAKENDVRKHAADLVKKLEPLFSFINGTTASRSSGIPNRLPLDSYIEFESRLERTLESFAIPLDVYELTGMDAIPAETQEVLYDLRLSLPVNFQIITGISLRLHASLRKVADGEHLDDPVDSLPRHKDGQAFKKLIRNIKKWAKHNNLPHAANKADHYEATPLAEFTYNLLQVLPENCRPNIKTTAALGKHFQRAAK